MLPAARRRRVQWKGDVLTVDPELTEERRMDMAGSTYNIIELVGTSDTSWEDAAKSAVEKAAQTVRDLRVAEVIKLDMTVENGKVKSYRARVNVSFKYEKET